MSETTDAVIEANIEGGMPAVEYRRIIRDHSLPTGARKAGRLAEHIDGGSD